MKRKRVDQQDILDISLHKTISPFVHHLDRTFHDKRTSVSELDWNELPLEILLEILLYIRDPKSLLRCSLVSTTWNLLINQNDQKIWKNICLSEWKINQNNENKHFLEECSETTINDSDAELCGVDCWKQAWLKSNSKNGNIVKDTKRVIYEFIASTSTDLFLGRMKFPAVPSMLFSLSHLKELFLDGNDMKYLPWQLCYLTSLTKLDLSRNLLTCLPERLTSLVNLQHLLVSNNKFSAFPPQIFSFTQLASLNLSYNNIGIIPPQVSVLTNLVSLYLCDTKLSAIPPELSALAKLHDLNLLLNNIGSLPPALSTLTSLRYLFLSKNRFTSISSVPLCCWTELVTLNLDGNLLTSLPSDFSKLTNLQFLNLSDNLVSFERSQFRTLKHLYVFNGIRVQLE